MTLIMGVDRAITLVMRVNRAMTLTMGVDRAVTLVMGVGRVVIRFTIRTRLYWTGASILVLAGNREITYNGCG